MKSPNARETGEGTRPRAGSQGQQAGADAQRLRPKSVWTEEDSVKVQRAVVICWVIAKITSRRHLVGKPTIDSLVKMRRLNVEHGDDAGSRQAQGCRFQSKEVASATQSREWHSVRPMPVQALPRRRIPFHESFDSSENFPIDVILSLPACFQFALRHTQRMVAAFTMCTSFGALISVRTVPARKWAERIARSLHKKYRRPDRSKHFVAQFGGIATAAKRIT